MKKNMLIVFALGMLISGCETLKMPPGPDISTFALIPNAPLVIVSVTDTRTRDKIGTIGLDTLKVKKSDTPTLARNCISEFLYGRGINVTQSPSIDFGQIDSIRAVANALHAQGVIKFDVNAIHVRSIDLILDAPEYEVDVFLAIYSADGEAIFHEQLHGSTESRAFTSKGAGDAVETALRNAILVLNGSNEFDKAIDYLKKKNASSVVSQ